jgi:hypothetical protein
MVLALASAGEAAAGCAQVTSSDVTLRVHPSIKAQVVARLQAGDLVDTDLKEHCQWDAFQTRKVCDRDGDWIKVKGVWRKDDLLEVAGLPREALTAERDDSTVLDRTESRPGPHY